MLPSEVLGFCAYHQALRDQQIEIHRQRHEEEVAHLKRLHQQELANQSAALSPEALRAIMGGGDGGNSGHNMPATLQQAYRGTAGGGSDSSCFFSLQSQGRTSRYVPFSSFDKCYLLGVFSSLGKLPLGVQAVIDGLGIRREERELRKKVEEMTEKIGRLEAQLENAERAEKDAIRVVEEERVRKRRLRIILSKRFCSENCALFALLSRYL